MENTTATNQDEIYIVGQVAAIFFENPTNFYKVMLISVNSTNSTYKEKEIVVTGNFGQIQEEELYRFTGDFVDHPKYGKQFQITTYQQEKPTSTSGIVAYLSSNKFPGIGKRTAENIVDTLGDSAIDVIMAEPERLSEVPNLNEKKRQVIIETIRLNYGMEQIVMGLSQYGFGNQLSMTIYQVYKEETLDIIHENPYRLAEDIEGIGFKKADNLAEKLGYEADSPKRIRAAILHEMLHSSLATGNTYMEAEELLKITIQTLEKSRPFEINPDLVATEIIELVDLGKIQQEGTRLYENSLYFSEWGIGTSVQRLLSRKKEIKYNEKDVEKTIRLIEKKFSISYGDSQIEAMKKAIKSPMFILTGGPGTGKTTVINGIVTLFAELNGLSLDVTEYHQEIFPILLAAPTGRAAKRMNETTGLPASTIHRLLGLTGREKNTSVSAKELEGGLLIVDEMSMVDTWLANTLLKAIPTNMQVIFVGDKDQLPSVGPGQVLHDLLAVPEIPNRELNEIYRQEDGSSIVSLAHQIKNGKMPSDFQENKKDRSFFLCNAYQIEAMIRQIVTKAKAKGFTAQDIQVLAPMYRGVAGIDALNKMMQEIFNPNENHTRKEVVWNDKVYRIGDKVLQLVNSPESNVFNGDMGEIVGIILAKESEDKVDELVIQFDSTEVTYKRNEWNKITLSYCCSIHKSQGSEFKMVILPMVRQYQRMLQRNLLYTGITRSKDLLILLGEPSAFIDCVENKSVNRQTSLISRINSSETMGTNTRLKLEAYESGLIKEDDEVMEKTYREKEPSKMAHEPLIKQTNERKELKKIEEISLFNVKEDSSLYSIESNKKKDENQEKSSVVRLTTDMITKLLVDPMVGMQDCTPYDFM